MKSLSSLVFPFSNRIAVPKVEKTIQYRADIDGLRAIAVLLVLSFHGGLSLFPSGFIGVDIFFVISGYLITAICYSGIKSNKFSLSNFYARRLWRLQPNLIAVMLFTSILAALYYLPEDLISYANSARYAASFISNQHFSRVVTSYAATDSSFLLLLHTWSLSIEWQWYLILPAGLVFLFKKFSHENVKHIVLGFTIGAVLLSLYFSRKYPDKSYFLLTSRMFEFLMGSCVVFWGGSKKISSSFWATVLGVVFFCILIFIATLKNIDIGFPDYHAIIVCFSVAVLIFVGEGGNGFFNKVLSAPILVNLGKMSYSLYLWHWPIFATGKYIGFENNIKFKAFCYLMTFFVAFVSYSLIEKPCRRMQWALKKTVFSMIFLPIFISIALYTASSYFNGFPERFGAEYSRINSEIRDYSSKYRESCIDGDASGISANCIIGNRFSKRKALLIGDSHSNHFWGFFDVLAKDANLSISVQGTSSCLTLPNIYLFDWWTFKNTVYQNCYNNTQQYFQRIKNNKFDYVIIGQVWINYSGDNVINNLGDPRSVALSRGRVEAALRNALNIIEESGAKPVIMKTIYSMPENYFACYYKHIKLRQSYGYDNCDFSTRTNQDTEWFSILFSKLNKDYPGLIVIDPKDIQCRGGTCKTEINGVPIYRDVGHLNDYASYKFGNEYLKYFQNPLKN
ncbi:acyltransferase family protein [Chromobacterium vaccinii]|uniref:acyltransferase family protein n=1 Tax=Chromobacterium vaccinii TaxID=1108595 RepID=UPI0009F3EE00|nr:acyltransferase family protein [Chromobacterium vaccinii]